MKKLFTLLMLIALGASSLFAARTPIKGTRVASQDRMYQFVVNKKSYSASEKEELKKITAAFATLGDKYGIRGDIALCQSIIETGWFKYTGGTAVTPDQHNYCGLGVTKIGKKGASFDTVEEGVEAQLQHLWAYCCKDPLPSWATCVDPRFGYVSRGRCITWEGLSGDWSTASNYGYLIMDMYADMMAYSMPNPSLTASPTSVTLSGNQGGTKPTKTVTITAKNTSTALKYNSSSSAFVVTEGSGWNSSTGGTLIITLDTSKAAGSYSGYVAVISGSDQRVEIQCTGTITGDGSSTTPPVTPDTDDTVVSGTLGTSNLNANATSFTLKGIYGSSEMSYVDIKIVGSGLSKAISVASATSAVSVTKQSGWNDLTGGTLRMELNTNFVLGTGSRESYVALESGDYRIQIPCTVILTNADGTIPTEPDVDDSTPVADSYIVEGTLGDSNLSANATSFTLTGMYGSSEQPYVDVKITGTGLTSDITYATMSSVVKVTALDGWNATTGGTLRMTLNTKFGEKATSYTGAGDYFVAVQSSSSHRIEIPFTANLNGKESDGSSSGDGTLGDDYLKVNVTSFTLEGIVGATDAPYVDVVVTGNNLSADITVNSNSGSIIPTTQAGWDARKGGTVRMTLNTSFKPSTYESFVAIQSTSSHRIELPFKVVLKEGTTTEPENPEPEPEPEPEPIPDADSEINISSLHEEWNTSATAGNLASASWFSTVADEPTRDMCYANGKLYVLNTKIYGSNRSISILDANTGVDTGKDLSVEGLPSSTAGIKSLGNTVLACTYATGSDKAVTVYKWADDNAKPEVLFTTTEHGNDQVGRSFNTYGDMNNGIIAFANTTQVVYYIVTNGVVNTTPNILNVATEGSNSNQSVAFTADGSFWLNNASIKPTHYSATGAKISSLEWALARNNDGVGIKAFTYGKRNYVAFTSAVDGTKNALVLANVTDEAAPVAVGKWYPEAGLGITSWGGVANTAVDYTITSDNVLNIWVMVPMQGIAMYKSVGEVTGIEDIELNAQDAPVEFYNLQGVRVDGENLSTGIYIRRQGNTTSKILVK